MWSKKEAKGEAAADKIKAVALAMALATKGVSRAQAEKAANAATRNVNGYGQKEEGPSRWEERKELKRQMYWLSTEKPVTVGERKDIKRENSRSSGIGHQQPCQKCHQVGHWTYECKNERIYMSRPSRSQLLQNPKLREKPYLGCNWSEDFPEEKKRKHSSDHTDSTSNSETASNSGSDRKTSSSSGTGSDRKKRNNIKHKGSRKRYSSSSSDESSSSDYDDSTSDSDSDSRTSRKKSKKHSRKR